MSCGFGIGLAVGLLISVAMQSTGLSGGLRVVDDMGFEHLVTAAEVQVEIARREVAEKTVEVLQHIAVAHGGRAHCSDTSDRGTQEVLNSPSVTDAAARSSALAAAGGEQIVNESGASLKSALKIYVYTLPADFNTNMLDSRLPRKFDCRASM